MRARTSRSLPVPLQFSALAAPFLSTFLKGAIQTSGSTKPALRPADSLLQHLAHPLAIDDDMQIGMPALQDAVKRFDGLVANGRHRRVNAVPTQYKQVKWARQSTSPGATLSMTVCGHLRTPCRARLR